MLFLNIHDRVFTVLLFSDVQTHRRMHMQVSTPPPAGRQSVLENMWHKQAIKTRLHKLPSIPPTKQTYPSLCLQLFIDVSALSYLKSSVDLNCSWMSEPNVFQDPAQLLKG